MEQLMIEAEAVALVLVILMVYLAAMVVFQAAVVVAETRLLPVIA